MNDTITIYSDQSMNRLISARTPKAMLTSSLPPFHLLTFPNPFPHPAKFHPKSTKPNFSTAQIRIKSVKGGDLRTVGEYEPGWVDDLFLKVFRSKMVKETGWDSEKPGYDGLIEVANRLMIGRTNAKAREAAVRVLTSLFPPFLLGLYRMLITPIGGGRIAAVMIARVTAITCQWLMGRCSVNVINLLDGSFCESGVFVEKCKYLEESKCVGICVNTCKIPTQTFFKDFMGIPLLMEPNFTDYSCQFNFGVHAPPPEEDNALKEPCLEICPNATRRRVAAQTAIVKPCPKS